MYFDDEEIEFFTKGMVGAIALLGTCVLLIGIGYAFLKPLTIKTVKTRGVVTKYSSGAVFDCIEVVKSIKGETNVGEYCVNYTLEPKPKLNRIYSIEYVVSPFIFLDKLYLD